MYYYYYYYYSETVDVQLNLRLSHEDGAEPVGLHDLTSFLNAIDELNKRVLYISQPEYKFPESLTDFEKRSLLHYHELKVKHICRENPFDVVLVLQLASFGSPHYWVLWKVLILLCKKYGGTTGDLHETIKSAWKFIEPLYDGLKAEKVNRVTSDLLGMSSESPKMDKVIEDIERMVTAILTDAKTKKYYDSFCTGLFTIDKVVGVCDLLDFNIDLILEDD